MFRGTCRWCAGAAGSASGTKHVDGGQVGRRSEDDGVRGKADLNTQEHDLGPRLGLRPLDMHPEGLDPELTEVLHCKGVEEAEDRYEIIKM